MASLKEVKTRISTVNSTRKITSAMKMVASSKLHRAQMDIERMRPYEAALDRMMSTFVSNMSDELSSPFAIKREVKRVALVVFTSNSSLCGGFNGNVIKMVQKTVDSYRKSNTDIVRVYAIGRKGAEAVRKLGFEVENDYASLLDHPSYDVARGVAQELMALYTSGEVDEVKMIYHHFKSSATQLLTQETFLPISLQQEGKVEKNSGPSLNQGERKCDTGCCHRHCIDAATLYGRIRIGIRQSDLLSRCFLSLFHKFCLYQSGYLSRCAGNAFSAKRICR